jgi:hypothetical protein
MGHPVDDVQLEDISRPTRSPVSADRKFFTFSAPMSFSGASPESLRYTPEARGPHPERTFGAQFGLDTLSEFDPGHSDSDQPPEAQPKTRRKLAIGADKRSESDASAAAALLGLSGSGMMLCS